MTCPGVYLPHRDDVYLSVHLFGENRKTQLISPTFPLLFHERFRINKVDLEHIWCVLIKSTTWFCARQLNQWRSLFAVVELKTDPLFSDFLHHWSDIYERKQHVQFLQIFYTAFEPSQVAANLESECFLFCSSTYFVHLQRESVHEHSSGCLLCEPGSMPGRPQVCWISLSKATWRSHPKQCCSGFNSNVGLPAFLVAVLADQKYTHLCFRPWTVEGLTIELIQLTGAYGTVLASYTSSAKDFLYPFPGTTYSRRTQDRDVLMDRSIHFPVRTHKFTSVLLSFDLCPN